MQLFIPLHELSDRLHFELFCGSAYHPPTPQPKKKKMYVTELLQIEPNSLKATLRVEPFLSRYVKRKARLKYLLSMRRCCLDTVSTPGHIEWKPFCFHTVGSALTIGFTTKVMLALLKTGLARKTYLCCNFKDSTRLIRRPSFLPQLNTWEVKQALLARGCLKA